MTASLSSPSRPKKRPPAASCCPTPPNKSPSAARVRAVGAGKLRDDGKRTPVSVVVGDEVLYGRYGGTDVEVSNRELKILRESDILAKVVK